MKVVNHKLTGVRFVPSPNMSGYMEPTVALMHYTAGYTAESAINTLTNRAAKVSAHLVIGQDGEITQLVPFNRVGWHAGRSKFMGRSGVNNFSIGFEFVNPGYFVLKNGHLYDAYDNKVSATRAAEYDLSIKGRNPKVGSGVYIWPGYNKPQIDAGVAAFEAICEAYDIQHVATHEEVDVRGWKTDPGPAFPMNRFVIKGDVNDRSDGGSRCEERKTVSASKLRVRKGPGIMHGVITVLPRGSKVCVLEDTGAWSRVEYAPGKQGWLADKHIG